MTLLGNCSSKYLDLLFQLATSSLNGLHFSMLLGSICCLIGNYFMLNFVFTMITFKQLRQQAQLLRFTRSLFCSSNSRLQSIYFGSFARHHTATTRMTQLNSVSFGSTILAFVVGCSLSNSYFAYLLLLTGQMSSPFTVTIMSHFLVFQWLLIGGMHLLAAQYATRIHAPKRELLAWSAEMAGKSEARQNKIPEEQQLLNLHFFLKLNNYATRLNSANRYGLNYGRRLGLVSVQSFQKVKSYSTVVNIFLTMF